METRTIGITRALGWERTADGIECPCVTEGLAAARVSVSVAAPRVVRVRITPGPLATAKTFSCVVEPPDPGSWPLDAGADTITLRTPHLVVEARLDPWRLTFRSADGRLLTHEVSIAGNFAGSPFGSPAGFEVEILPQDPARRVLPVLESL